MSELPDPAVHRFTDLEKTGPRPPVPAQGPEDPAEPPPGDGSADTTAGSGDTAADTAAPDAVPVEAADGGESAKDAADGTGPEEYAVPEPSPLGLEPDATGNPEVDTVLQRLSDADRLPTPEHLGVYEEVHDLLRAVLASLDTRPGPPRPGPAGPRPAGPLPPNAPGAVPGPPRTDPSAWNRS